MRAEVELNSAPRSRPLSRVDVHRAAPSSAPPDGVPAVDDDQSEWAKQEQQVLSSISENMLRILTIRIKMIIRQQDDTIDTIAGTLHTLQEQAGLMGQEIGEHNE